MTSKHKRQRARTRGASPGRRVRRGRRRPRVGEDDGSGVAIALRDGDRARSLARVVARKTGLEVAVLASPEIIRRLVRRPAILILEVAEDGADVRRLREFARENPELRIIALGTHNGDPLHVIESGASILLGGERSDDVVRAVADVAKGKVSLDPAVTDSVVRRLHELARICEDDGIDPQRCALLSKREREVCEHLSRGSGNADIADDLGLSLGTVKTHVHNVLQKLEVGDRRTAGAYWRLYRQSGPGKI